MYKDGQLLEMKGLKFRYKDQKICNFFEKYRNLLNFNCIFTTPSEDETSDLLLTDELLMRMCGFNAYQVKNGSCERGVKLRKTHSPEVASLVNAK